MRENKTYPLAGQPSSLIPDYLLQVEAAICDGIYTDQPVVGAPQINQFGRGVIYSHAAGAGQLSGWAGSGWRVAGFLSRPDQLSLNSRRAIAQRQLPVVLHLTEFTAGFDDWIILQAIDAMDAIRLTLLAHHVAERALMPVVVITDPRFSLEEKAPAGDQLAQFVGLPEALIQTPTPAQEMLFGPRRRCVPNQFSFDQPVVRNAAASKQDAQRSALAYRRFVLDHIPDLLAHSERELATYLPGHQSTIVTHGGDKADHLLLVLGTGAHVALQAPENKPLFGKAPFQYAALRVLNPWPTAALQTLTENKTSWTTLIPLDAGQSDWQVFAERWLSPVQSGVGKPSSHSIGYYRSEITLDHVQAINEKMTSNTLPGRFFLDMVLHPNRSDSAQQEVLLHELQRAYPGLDAESLLVQENTPSAPVYKDLLHSLPDIVRNQEDHGPPYSRLTHFYKDVILGRTESSDVALTTDPFSIQGVMPPLTDLLRLKTDQAFPFPGMDTDKCTGCGQCMVQCPFAAMPSLAIRMEDLLRAGMTYLSKSGQSTPSLTPLVKNLATFWSARCQAGEDQEGVLMASKPALVDLLAQMDTDPQKGLLIHSEFDRLIEALDQMSWVKTQLYFDGPESQKAGGGELFAIAIDPHACTGCGICVEVCPEDALSLKADSGVMQSAISAHQLWERLPDTAASTIARIHGDPAAAPLSGIMLSRHYYQSVIGGESQPELWGARMILHALSAVTESVIQPRWHEKLTALKEIRTALDVQVKQHLQEAMPGTLDANLEQLLDRSGHKQVALKDILSQLTTDLATHHRVDTGKLSRWIHLNRELAQLEEALATGTTGAGRARYGVLLGGQLADALVQYPHHPLQVPVWIEPVVDIQQINALVASQQRNMLDQVRLLRRAALEAKGQYRPEIQDETIANLNWSDLTAKEKEFLPPLLIVLDTRDLQALPTKDLIALLSADAPVKILAIQRDLPGPASTYERQGWILPLITSRCSPVFQTAASNGAHFSSSLQQAVHTAGPALIHVQGYSQPSGETGGTWLDRDDELVVSGLFPLISWVPRETTAYLSENLEISNIPDLSIPVDGLIPAWIHEAWTSNGALPLNWKELLTAEWRTWLEWSGRTQAGDSDSVKETRKTLEAAFDTERKALIQEHQSALQEMRQGLQEEVRIQLADRLYQLAQTQRARREEEHKMDQTV